MRAVLTFLAVLPLAVPGCNGQPSRPATCQQAKPQITVTGRQPVRVEPVAVGSTLRAVGAVWTWVGDYQVSLLGDAPAACMVGGVMIGEWPDSDRWSKWHDRAALRFSQPGFTVFGVHVVNAGSNHVMVRAALRKTSTSRVRGCNTCTTIASRTTMCIRA